MKKKLIFCQTKVNKSGISRENRDGVEHIIITSYTLPPDIVMNGGLYPSEEVKSSFKTLERTLAPLEHPEVNGQFISASDPVALNDFYVGAWNENVEQMDDGRIKVDKVINVQNALKSEKGKRLLDRVAALEEGSDTRSIHTSVGVFLEIESLDSPKVNAAGEEYTWIARNMIFDHDAILLDNVGAATPSKGVGIGVNKEKVDVEFITCDKKPEGLPEVDVNISLDGFLTNKQVKDIITNIEDDLTEDDFPLVPAANNITNNELSFADISEKLFDQLNEGIVEFEKKSWIVAIFDEDFVYETPGGEMFRSRYSVDEKGNLEISDTKLPVERVVEYRPINPPSNSEDNAMRDKIIAKLKELGIEVNSEISDEELQAQYESALTANTGDDDDAGNEEPNVNNDLAQTVQDQAKQIESLQSQIKANEDAKISEKIKTIRACSKYSAISEASLKAIHANSKEEFESMYTDSIPSHGVGSTTNFAGNGQDDQFKTNTKVEDLPE